MEKVIQKWCFLRFCYDIGGPRASRKQLRRRNRKWPEKVAPGVSFSGGYFGSFLLPKRIWEDSVDVYFYAYFFIAFGKPSVAVLEIWGSFQGPF